VRERPAIAIFDIGLPGRDGIALTRVVKIGVPDTRVVIVTMNEDNDGVIAALAAGASAYCVKSSDPSTAVEDQRFRDRAEGIGRQERQRRNDQRRRRQQEAEERRSGI
jgi:DNA-binding NarL/FixJ family response regulator